MPEKIIIIAETEECKEEAAALASSLNTSICDSIPDGFEGVVLKLDENGLGMLADGMLIKGDFTRMIPRLRKNNLNGEMLIKAVKISNAVIPLTVIDATAGMGEDSLLLAGYGFNVILFERDPVIAALLRDTINRARHIPELSEIVSRMELREGDSISAMNEGSVHGDIVLLDPMFPERQKSGLVKKKFQIIHHLEKPCDDEESLLNAAISVNPRRIVIKRPAKGPFLAGKKPSYSLQGKAIRYDCIALN